MRKAETWNDITEEMFDKESEKMLNDDLVKDVFVFPEKLPQGIHKKTDDPDTEFPKLLIAKKNPMNTGKFR